MHALGFWHLVNGFCVCLSTPCAHAHDFAVAAPSVRTLMPAIDPAFRIIERVTCINLNFKKCYWVQCGYEACGTLHRWVVDNCPDFRVMNMARVAKYVGATLALTATNIADARDATSLCKFAKRSMNRRKDLLNGWLTTQSLRISAKLSGFHWSV